MRAARFRVIVAVAALAVAAAVLHAPASANPSPSPAATRSGSPSLAAVGVAPVSHAVEQRDERDGSPTKALRGPILLMAVLVALLDAARRGGRSTPLHDSGARHRSDRWTVSLRGPPPVFS